MEFWERLDKGARIGLGAGGVVIAVLVGALALWVYRPDYQVLFADLAPGDAAAMVAELDKQKTPYQLAGNGNTILVPQDQVYRTRLALMGKDVPLHGAVGFEVFNNADFGMTDFVQKVNYQRAVQGELTRTILAIDGIQAARVHLALPEQGLFKKAQTKNKASVTVTMKYGHALAPDQVAGIQRLVAASVPDMQSADVTVLDQHGVALTRATGAEAEGEAGLGALDSKRATEDYLDKKLAQVLDSTFGAGEAIASVDVALNLDQTKVTTDEVLPARGPGADGTPTGVVVRERHTVQEADGTVGASKPAAAPARTSSEADYQVGRRVEQVAVAPGGVRRMTVAVVVRKALNEDQRAQLREVVANAVGLNEARGDTVVVNTLSNLVTEFAPPRAPAAAAEAAAPTMAAAAAPAAAPRVLWILLALLVLAATAGAVLLGRRARVPAPRLLDDAERARMVAELRQWLDGAPAGDEERA